MRFGSCIYCHRVIAIVNGTRVCGSCYILDQRDLVQEESEDEEEDEEEEEELEYLSEYEDMSDSENYVNEISQFFEQRWYDHISRANQLHREWIDDDTDGELDFVYQEMDSGDEVFIDHQEEDSGDEAFVGYREGDSDAYERPPLLELPDDDSIELASVYDEVHNDYEESDAYDSEGPPAIYSLDFSDEEDEDETLSNIVEESLGVYFERLYSIRERLRQNNDYTTETLIQQLLHIYVANGTHESNTKGATESQMAALKRRMLTQQELLDGYSSNECTICTETYDDKLELTELPCSHEYHSACIRQWLRINSTCPICRQTLAVSISNHSVEFMDDVD
ncbi:hypothetical protein EDC96DRAFT_526073 [Choanephora cucurbitarum]|nr:hypothetical protein EDC96DRAFT_526073 [Choanephora cucurbitarum]